jgi:GDP-L-fucose synthase
MHFIFDLIRKILRGRVYGDPVVLWGDGHQKRELVYVDDFVRTTLSLSDRENDLINIGAGEEFTIRHFARIICDKVGFDPEQISYDTSRYVGARSKCLSVEKLESLLPNLERTPLEVGLGRTVQWFMDDPARFQ